jgi:hypothetical protein
MHPDTKIRYRASDMILNVHSDFFYLTAPKARSHAVVYFFLGGIPRNSEPILVNIAIHITCTTLKCIAASAVEAELGTLFQKCSRVQKSDLSLKKTWPPTITYTHPH